MSIHTARVADTASLTASAVPALDETLLLAALNVHHMHDLPLGMRPNLAAIKILPNLVVSCKVFEITLSTHSLAYLNMYGCAA